MCIRDRTSGVGGRVRTAEYSVDGETLVADSGMEEYWESNPAVKILKELKLPLNQDISTSSMILGGKVRPFLGTDSRAYLEGLFGEKGLESFRKFQRTIAPLVEKHDLQFK